MADHEITSDEMTQLRESLRELFQLDEQHLGDLIELAEQKHDQLVSLYEMTQILNSNKDQELKKKIVFAMWCIALADKNKDKYEEHLIRKVADLLYISHSDFIQARLQAESRYT